MAYGTVNVPGVAEVEAEKLREEILQVVGSLVSTGRFYTVFEAEDWTEKENLFELRIPKTRHNIEPPADTCMSSIRQYVGRNAVNYIGTNAEEGKTAIVNAVKAAIAANKEYERLKPTALTGLTVGDVKFPADILAPGGTESKPVELAVTVTGETSPTFTLTASFSGTAKYGNTASDAKSNGTALTSGSPTEQLSGEEGPKVLYIWVSNGGAESYYKLTVSAGEEAGEPTGKTWDTENPPYPTHDMGNGHIELTWEQVQLYLLESLLLPAEEAAAKAEEKNINWKPEEITGLDLVLAAAYIPALDGSTAGMDKTCTLQTLRDLGFHRKWKDEAVEKYDINGELFSNTWNVLATSASWDMVTKDLVLLGDAPYAGDVLVMG